MRLVGLCLLSACWHSPPVPAPTVEPYTVPPPDPVVPPVACASFSADDPACTTTCHRDAPDDWSGCTELQRDLIAEGYTCSNLHPRTCLSPLQVPLPACPPGGCVPFDARVISIRVDGNTTVIAMSGGRLQGVTTSWKATMLDRARTPVAGGAVTLTRIDRALSVGTVTLTAAQVQQAPFVRLEP